jgi:adenylate cyclase
LSAELYESFQLEIIKSEIQRTKVLLGAFCFGFVALIINYFFLDDELLAFYGNDKGYLLSTGWLAVFIGYELVLLGYILKMQKLGKDLTRFFRTAHSFIEVSFPTLMMFYNVEVEGLLGFIDSPVFLLYFLFIILSILHLDLRLSLFTGFQAALQYILLIFYGFHFADIQPHHMPGVPENSFYLRGVVFLISGAAAGFVANELQKRIRSTFEITESMIQMERLFGQQVSREIVQALVENEEAKKQEATVLALDIRNFSAFAEQRSPDEILEFQNKIFGPILEIINQHQGIVLQIMGDGVMATFGTPVSNPLHADMAFQSALAIIQKIKKLSEQKLIPYTRIGIGLHTGEVIMGNIGNENRKQFSISGTAVIIAFRVEQLNKDLGSEFLITEEVKNRIAPGKNVITPLGLQSLKGFGTSLSIYRVG